MPAKDNIVDQVRKRAAKALQASQRGLILQGGAIGDCILTLPLARFMKQSLGLGGIDMVGHTEYIGFLPGRTCVEGVASIDTMGLHRLFADAKTFDLIDCDPLINAFVNYTWIATFLGGPDSHFEKNLIFTVNCSHSAEVMTLSMKPPPGHGGHLTQFYVEQFIAQSGMTLRSPQRSFPETLIGARPTDIQKGRELLTEAGVCSDREVIIIHPGSGGREKCWHLENFLEVAKQLAAEGIETVFLLGPAEMERIGDAERAGIEQTSKTLTNLSLTEVLAVIYCADAFVGNDSGITHLAGGLGAKTTAIFGPTDPKVYGPIGPAVQLVKSTEKGFSGGPSKETQQKVLRALLG